MTMHANRLAMAVNRLRQIGSMFPGFFPQGDTKRDAPFKDYGYPEFPTFWDFYNQYERNGIAAAGVQRAIEKCWEDEPWLLESGEVHEETERERAVREWAERIQLWSKLKEADERSRVGDYAAVILRFADGKLPRMPVQGVRGGLNGLVEVIPVWEKQLSVADWVTDENSLDYGKVTMYHFNEAAVFKTDDEDRVLNRSYDVHPDRVIVWSKDGAPFGRSALKSGLNDLITMQKIIGAGGEGFWKNAKSAPHLNIDKDADMQKLAQSLGADSVDDIADKMGEQVDDWVSGLDNLLLTQSIEAKSLNVDLPDPENYFGVALQSFSASVNTPVKILIGNQTGERASSEDNDDWNKTNMSRRRGYIIPNIKRFVDRLTAVGVLPDVAWFIDWSDLTESSMAEKIARSEKMADVNQKMRGTGELVWLADEIREVAGYEPLEETETVGDNLDDEEDEPQTNRRRAVRPRGRLRVNIHAGKPTQANKP